MLTPTHPCPSLRLLRKPFLSPGPLTSLPVFIRRPACHLLANRSSDFTLHRENEGQRAGDQSPQGIKGWLCQIADTFNSAPQAVHPIDHSVLLSAALGTPEYRSCEVSLSSALVPGAGPQGIPGLFVLCMVTLEIKKQGHRIPHRLWEEAILQSFFAIQRH